MRTILSVPCNSLSLPLFPSMEASAAMSMKTSTTSCSSSANYASLFSISSNPNTKNKLGFGYNRTNQFAKPFSFRSIKCIQSRPPPDSKPPTSSSPFSCSAVTFSPSPTSDFVPTKLHHLITEFQSLPQAIDRVKRLIHYATLLPPFPQSSRVDSNRVMGCTARVWLDARLDQCGKMRFLADSDSEITRGFAACLIWVLDGAAPEEVLRVKTEDLAPLNVGLPGAERSRVNTWHNVLLSMQKRTKKLVAEREGKAPLEPFPSLVVSSTGVHAKGTYAEAQVRYQDF